MNDLPDNLAQIAVRLSGIATNMCLALSVCDSEKAIKTMVRNHCDKIHAIAESLLSLAKKGGPK